MKKFFKKSLAICLMAALVLSAMMGAMVVSAEGVVAAKGTLTGCIEFAYNTAIDFEPVDGATAYGAEVYRTDKGEAKAVDVVFDSIDDAVVGISNISLNNINKTFTFMPYAIVEDVKVYADAFTSSYAEWLVSKKDGNRLNAEINNVLDTYAAITGETVYEGQNVALEAAPEGVWAAANAGNGSVSGSFNTADGKNAFQTTLDITYPESSLEPDGNNLVPNGDFEADFGEGWTADNYERATIETFGEGDSANKTLSPWNTWTYSPEIAIEKNTNYRVSIDYASDNGRDTGTRLYFYIRNVTANSNFKCFWGASDEFPIKDSALMNWKTYTYEFNSGSMDKVALWFNEQGLCSKTYVDNIRLEKLVATGVQDVLNTTFEEAEYTNWITASSYAGGQPSIGRYPLDNSKTFCWLADKNTCNGANITLKKNTWYTMSADVYAPEGKTIYFSIHDGEAINGIGENEVVRMTCGEGAWRTETKTFYSGDYEGDFLLTVANWGDYTGEGTGWADGRVRYDNVLVTPTRAGAVVYKDGARIGDVAFAKDDTFAVAIGNISFANLAKQYTIVPFNATVSGATAFGEEIVVSYADFLAHALNNGDADQKAQAYAICKAYKAAYGEDLCVLAQ